MQNCCMGSLTRASFIGYDSAVQASCSLQKPSAIGPIIRCSCSQWLTDRVVYRSLQDRHSRASSID